MRGIHKVLVANRGEVAVRIIRACREMNIQTVAVYANVDKDSFHVMLADEAVCIGDYRLDNSYLNKAAIIQAALNTGATAIHPGFGFLSENASFARECEAVGIIFIGPSAEVMEKMGDKVSARNTMEEAGVPIVPGSMDAIANSQDALNFAKSIGFPVLIKASSGGGGKGMRICYEESLFQELFHQAQTEAKNAFGDERVYIEKFIENPRHIEVQVLGDTFGNVVHLYERECSIQRNNQKLIEEAPVRNLKESTRNKLYKVSVEGAKQIGYVGAGTFEFIMDKEENFYFIEMNTRLQVEHPISELITGVDIVKEQIHIAKNRRLSIRQEDIKRDGCAIEVRINAEKIEDGFKPMSGTIESLHFPGGNGVRMDSFVYPGYTVLPFYDSMIGKLIVHGRTRDEALEKAIRSLEEMDINGLPTNIEFQLEIILSEAFQDHKYHTGFVKEFLKER